jgi:hypothetical protein
MVTIASLPWWNVTARFTLPGWSYHTEHGTLTRNRQVGDQHPDAVGFACCLFPDGTFENDWLHIHRVQHSILKLWISLSQAVAEVW